MAQIYGKTKNIFGFVYNLTLSLNPKPQQMKPKPEMYDIKGWQLATIFLVILFLTQQLEKL